ncbi:MAG: M48 family metalloprotease [Bacteroidia bacterium]|nr:M48 family metalloprotease [Bacteroidia bacterium]
MKAVLFAMLYFLAAYACGQKQYKFPEKFNSFYDFRPDEAYKQIIRDNMPEEQKKAKDFYAVNYFYREQFHFDCNNIYMDWVEVENYFIRIMDKVLPKSIRRRNLNFFLERSASANAQASEFGNIYFNIGMLCMADNEAFVAGVLAHEAGHYFFNNIVRSKEEFSSVRQTSIYGYDFSTQKDAALYFKMKRAMEYQADTFAIACLVRAGINLKPLLDYQESNDVREQIVLNSRTYKTMLKASSLTEQQIKKRKSQGSNPYATHPSSLERFEIVKEESEKCQSCSQNFFIDSVFFYRLRNIAHEERKRICFEKARFDECCSFAVVDYMYEPKNLKNLYYIIESLRRKLIIQPELKEKGFLTDLVDDDFLYYHNKNIFHKPELILDNYALYEAMKDHPFVKDVKKPFETYEQGFIYFVNKARELNFNEANLSLGLYYHYLGKKDSSLKYFQAYLNNGNGLYKELAESMVNNGKPTINKGKTLFIYGNVGNYSGYRFNYYLTKQRKQQYNSVLRENFTKDSVKMDLVIVNELLGSSPARLQDIRKLMTSVFSLYDEDDIEKYRKIRINSQYAGENRPGTENCRKHLFLYAPEWYNWFKEHNYDKVFIADVVYQYGDYTSTDENFNTYTGYYLDFNLNRPYFRDASRAGTHRKDKESDMHREMHSFLYE